MSTTKVVICSGYRTKNDSTRTLDVFVAAAKQYYGNYFFSDDF